MANIASNIEKMNDVEVAHDAPHSEQLMVKLAANVNGLIDWVQSMKDALAGMTVSEVVGVSQSKNIGFSDAFSYTCPTGYSFRGTICTGAPTDPNANRVTLSAPNQTLSNLAAPACIPVALSASQGVSATISSTGSANVSLTGVLFKNAVVDFPDAPEISE